MTDRPPAIPAAFSPIPGDLGVVRFALRGANGWSRYVLAGLTLGAGAMGFSLLEASPGGAVLLLGAAGALACVTGWRWSRAASPLVVTVTPEALSWAGNDGEVSIPLAGIERVEALGDRSPTLMLRVAGSVVELDAGGHLASDVAALAASLAPRA